MAKENGNLMHQLLAVEPDLKNKAKGIFFEETKNTFEKKGEHFDGITKVYVPKESEGDEIPPVTKEINTTVAEKISYAQSSVIEAIDAELSKEETNCSGAVKADIVIGGKTVVLSATSLLALEKSLLTIRSVYKSIPTLDPTKSWQNDEQSGKCRYKTSTEVSYRTIKRNVPITLSAATEKHPAQVQMGTIEVQVGQWNTTYQSGRITPYQKSDLLARIDEMLLSVKSARAKANQAQVINIKLGKEIFDTINKGIL